LIPQNGYKSGLEASKGKLSKGKFKRELFFRSFPSIHCISDVWRYLKQCFVVPQSQGNLSKRLPIREALSSLELLDFNFPA